MGIYYRTEACGCVTFGTTYGPGSFLHEACGRQDCREVRAAAYRDAQSAREAEDIIDLARRVPGYSAERQEYLRNM